MRLLVVSVCLALIVSSGCEFLRPLPPGYAEKNGSHEYPHGPEVVYEACVTALQSGGYSLAVQRPDLGRIETGPRFTNVSGHVVQNTVSIESDADGWTLQIEPAGAGSRVIAYPRHFHNGVETNQFFLSELNGRWAPLFAAINNYLPR